MLVKNTIRAALEREVQKLVHRHNQASIGSVMDSKRYAKRSGLPAKTPSSFKPSHWQANSHFNPYHVQKNIDSFYHAIAQKVRTQSYKPNPSLLLPIPKPGGGFREIAISTVPDAAVSYWLGRRLIQRNSYRFSSYTYAYRGDRNAHHAIEHLMTSIRGKSRLYVLEYDFAKYFDSIHHKYLFEVIDKYFLVSKRERLLLQTLILNPRAHSLSDYLQKKFEVPSRGIPQGSNISLFLANVACHELDREIEQIGATFARYADDTLIVADSYEKADACAKLFLSHGQRSGTSINFSKSPGISLLTPDTNAEIRYKSSVTFLSHELSPAGVKISQKAISRIKRRVAKIIYNNLLLQPKRGAANASRIGAGFHDWDLVTCVNELRRYVYGRIAESAISKAIFSNGPVNTTLFAMSFYPTVDKGGGSDFQALDGWLSDVLERTYSKRVKLLNNLGISALPVARSSIISGSWYVFPQIPMDTQLPSFYRAWLYVRKAANIYGLSRFPSPTYGYL